MAIEDHVTRRGFAVSMDALFADLEQARDAWAGLYDLFVQAKYEVAGARTLDEIDTVFAEHY